MGIKRAALKQQTKRIAAQLVALRSGSALLEQMRRVTPRKFAPLACSPSSKLVIKGEAEGVDALSGLTRWRSISKPWRIFLDGTTVLRQPRMTMV